MAQELNRVTIFKYHQPTDKHPRPPDWKGKGAVEVNEEIFEIRIAGWETKNATTDRISLQIELDNGSGRAG